MRIDPRSTYVLTDRPDRWLEIGVDRQTGFIVLLVEHIGDVVTRHAQVISLGLIYRRCRTRRSGSICPLTCGASTDHRPGLPVTVS